MQGKRILFSDSDPRARRIAERALTATGSVVDTASDHFEMLEYVESEDYDLFMVDCAQAHLEDEEWLSALDQLVDKCTGANLVLHTRCQTEEYLPLMAKRSYLRNLIAKNEALLDPDELIITAEKLLRKDVFGLQKYLLWGVDPFRMRIEESARKREYLKRVANYASSLGCNTRSVEMIETVADELVTNAIFNAPRSPDGSSKYGKLSRRERIVLEDQEVGELQFACDGAYIAIAQVDPFGALTQDTVVSYLNRCLIKGPGQISDASGGAGIGLFRVFQSLSKLIINIDPGKKTEVITLIDLRLSMKRFRLASKSLHIFVVEQPGSDPDGDESAPGVTS